MLWYSRENYETYCYKSKLNSECSTFLFAIDSVTEGNVNLLSRCVAKPIYWYQFVLKESTGSQARRMGSSCSRDLNSPMAFREEFLKTGWGRGSWVCDQLLHNSLIGWWWDNRKMFWESQFSGSSWSYSQLLPGGVLLSAEQLKDMAQGIIYSPWGATKGPWLCLMTKLLLILSCLTVLLCFCIFSLLWLNFFFGTWRRSGRLKLFYRQEVEDTGESLLGKALQVLLGFNLTSSVSLRVPHMPVSCQSWISVVYLLDSTTLLPLVFSMINKSKCFHHIKMKEWLWGLALVLRKIFLKLNFYVSSCTCGLIAP